MSICQRTHLRQSRYISTPIGAIDVLIIKNNKDMMTNLQSSAFVARTTQLLSSVARLRLLLVMLLTLTASTAWGATETITITQTALGLSGSYTSSSKTIDGVTFDWTDLMKNSSNIQAKASSGAIWNSSPIPGNIVSVAVTHSGTARSSTMYFGASEKSTTESSTFSGTATIEPNDEYKYFYIKRSSNAAYWTKIVITYETTPAVNHAITWEVNGETYTTGSPTTSVPEGSKVTILPTAPTLDCSGKTFVGWSNQEVTDGNKPSVLFTTAENSPAINADTTFYAVFATNSGGGEGEISLTASDFGLTTSYATKTATVDGYSFTIDQGYLNGTNNIQMNSSRGNGILYNTTPIPGLSTITLNVASGTNTKTLYSGTTQQPTTSVGTTTSTKTFSIPAGNTYFKIGVSGANYFSSIVITYSTTSYSDYTTSCTTETAVYLIPKNSDFWMAHLRLIFGASSAASVALP